MRGRCELFVPGGVGDLVGSQGFCIVTEVGDELFFLLALFVIDWGRIGSGALVAVQQFMRTLLDGRRGHAVTPRSASDGRWIEDDRSDLRPTIQRRWRPLREGRGSRSA